MKGHCGHHTTASWTSVSGRSRPAAVSVCQRPCSSSYSITSVWPGYARGPAPNAGLIGYDTTLCECVELRHIKERAPTEAGAFRSFSHLERVARCLDANAIWPYIQEDREREGVVDRLFEPAAFWVAGWKTF